MDRSEKERIIARISWGYVDAVVQLINNPRQRLLLAPPTAKDLALASMAYDDALEEALSKGVLSQQEAIEIQNNIGTWTHEDETKLKGIQDDIHRLRRGMLDYLFKVDELERIRATIRKAEKALIERYVEKLKVISDTAESHALCMQQRVIIERVTRMPDGKRLWPTREAFDACADVVAINQLTNIYFNTSHLSEAVIRELARSDPWRTHWNTCKAIGQSPFRRPPTEWSYNQNELSRWSYIYDIVFESMDRPSEQVVEDDDLMDSWLIRQSERVASQTKKRESESVLGQAGGGKNGRNEMFVVADAKGAQRVYDLNDPTARGLVKQTQQFVSGKDTVREVDLPISRREMREQIVANRIRRTQ